MLASSCGCLTSHLLDLNDNKLRWFQRCKPDQNVHYSQVLVGRCGGFAVALYKVGSLRGASLKRTLTKQGLHESPDVQTDLSPQRLVVGLEHYPLSALIQARLDVQREAADRDVFVFVGARIAAKQSART